MQVPKLRTLKQWEEYFEGGIPASTLRAEVRAGNIRAIRARPGCNAPILISDKEMARWLDEVAGKRQLALSPTEAARANAAANPVSADSD